MVRKTRPAGERDLPRLGRLTQQHAFFLNPYRDVRFSTSCPGCNGKTKQRKVPLAIHVDDWGAVILNKTCRFCPYCDLLIAHQDELEAVLAAQFQERAPGVVGSDYVVFGTVERKAWRRGTKEALSNDELIDSLHDFKRHCRFAPAPRWQFP
jgi:hypothetical protein